MKSLFLLMLMTLSSFAGLSEEEVRNNQGLDMHLNTDLVFPEMVKVYDYDGNLIRALRLSDVVNNEISTSDHVVLEQSDFVFTHMGDYYYFNDEEELVN